MSPRRNRATCSRSRARLLRLRLALAASSDSSASDDASDDRTGRPRPSSVVLESLEPLKSLESLGGGGGGGQVSSSHASPLTNARANARLASLSRILASLTGSPHPKTVRFDRVARFSSNASSLVDAYDDDDDDDDDDELDQLSSADVEQLVDKYMQARRRTDELEGENAKLTQQLMEMAHSETCKETLVIHVSPEMW